MRRVAGLRLRCPLAQEGGCMKHLSIDIESFSSAPLNKCGVYKYAASPDFEILLFGYSADGGPVRVVDFTAGEQLPADCATTRCTAITILNVLDRIRMAQAVLNIHLEKIQ